MPSDPVASAPSKPGRTGVTFEQYETAYQELIGADGSPPSQRQIRRYLGSGSNTTLSAYRRRIAEQRVADQQPPEPHSLDATLLETVNRLVTQLSVDAAQVADDRVDEIQKAAQARIDQADKIADKVQKDTNLLKHRAEQAESSLVDARKRIETQQAQIEELRTQNAKLDAEKQSLTHELDHRQQALDVAKLANASVTKERDQAHAVISQRDKRLTELDSALRSQETSLASQLEKLEAQEAQLAARDQRIEQYEREVMALQLRTDTLQSAQESTSAQRDDLTRQLSSVVAELTGVKAQLLAEQQAHRASKEHARAQLGEKESTNQHLQQALATLTSLEKPTTTTGERP